jgi:predicted 3-demethylubiquinone-9 3-methyltransferase (glyoxalase superfamily)
MQKILPFLWFNHQAEAAMKFYTSIFGKSKVLQISRIGGEGRSKKGQVTLGRFRIEGQEFYALNGGPHFKFTPAISFYVNCRSQREVDRLWKKLSRGGKELNCGWVTDKYGVSWQIVPIILHKYMRDRDPVRSRRVFDALMNMVKIDVKGLRRAYLGK